MAAVAGIRSVDFHVPQPGAYAVQLRLTPALLETLLRAEEEGQGASIRFGAGQQANAISVGDVDFRFNALPEECCDLLHLPPAASGEGPAIVGAVRQKLMVQRNIQDERGRVRARAEEAERQGNERKAQLLHGKPAAGKAGMTTTLRRVTPPPQQQQLRSTPPPLAGRPPTHPASTLTAAGRSPIQPQPAAAPTAARPPLKSASAPKLAGGGATLQQTASPLVLQAARSSGGNNLRLCLIAMLSERAMPKGAVMSVLADAAARVPGFKPSKSEIDQMLKKVAEFRSPGKYVLYDMLLKELDTLPPAGSGSAATALARQASPSCQSGEAAAGRGKQKKAVSAPGAAAAGRKAATAAAAGSKRSRLDWSDDDSDAEEQQQPAAQRIKPQQQPAAPYASAAAAAASPPSISGAAAGGGSSSSGAPAALAAHPRRTSSSRGSDHADESWIEEHADRQPEPAAPITSREEYRRREAAFNAKYLSYFELHQLIQAHKKDYEALDALAREAPTKEERQRYRADLDALHRKRGSCAKRWDAAYRVLHQELAAAKARMAEFVQQLQQEQMQKQQQQAAGAGSAAGALPAVRVK